MSTPSARPRNTHQAILSLEVPEDVAALLDAIPSETTRTERRFLYKFFSTTWRGRENVVEIGPFLGGTTRAIALGMAANPHVADAARLVTFDKFDDYYAPEQLEEFIRPLRESGALSGPPLEGRQFLDVFQAVHSSFPYASRISAHSFLLPDNPGPIPRLPATGTADAVFVDGCKSWFGTKAFMAEILPRATPGAWFLFQDYGWYTCFWIPVFVEVFRDHFEPWARADTTNVFRLRKEIAPEDVLAKFPDTPEEFGEQRFRETFKALVRRARAEQDSYGVIRLSLQLAASLAYIGKPEAARKRIEAVLENPDASDHDGVIRAALKCPTYRPDGPVLLD